MPRTLLLAYEKQKQQRRTGCLVIKQFFESNAILCQDLTKAYEYCRRKVRGIKTDGWESEVLGLFKETYPLYPQEPLLLLIKSGVFIERDSAEYSAKKCADKLALFVLLAS